MLTIEDSVDNIVRLTIDGKVKERNLQRAATAIEEKVAGHGKVRMYAKVQDLEGYDSFSTFLTDAEATLRYYNDFEKVAIVTDKQWLGNLSDIANLMNPAEVKQFTPEEWGIAKHWIED